MRQREKESASESGPAELVAALALFVTVLLLVVQLVLQEKTPDTTTIALLLLASGLALALFAREQSERALKRVSSFKVAGVLEVGMRETTVLAARVEPPPPETETDPSDRKGAGYHAVIAQLKTKMQFTYTITDLHREIDDESRHFEIAIQLAADHLLRQKELEFVQRLLSGDDPQLDLLPSLDQEKFLDAAWTFADRFAFIVWDRFVRAELRGSGWEVFDHWRNGAPHQGFLAHHPIGGWALMVSRVGEPTPYYYRETRDWLQSADFGFRLAGRCIVIPGETKGKPRNGTVVGDDEEGVGSKVKVLKLQGSLREDPERGFEGSTVNQDGKLNPAALED